MTELQALAVEAVAQLRSIGTDTAGIEAKAGAGGLPKSVLETVSAFSNTEGGLILLGLDEHRDFAPVEIDASKLASDLASQASDNLEPSIRPEIEIVDVHGHQLVAARIEELDPSRKPCFVTARGMDRGSFHRTHDGDRILSSYEVHVLVASRGQPADDRAVVPGATAEDLDERLIDALVERLRSTRGPLFESRSPAEILDLVGVVAADDGVSRPTLAGLLALGTYPQRHLPQLNVTFVVFPTVKGEPLADGTRFLDNKSIDGPIPMMVAETLASVRRNMTRRSVVAGIGRDDIWEYPEEAIRELVTNALLHRDYHPMAQGTQVSVELFPDRLVIRSPGGLFGPVSREDLLAEPVSSSRNGHLAKLLEDVEIPGTGQRVCENRATGLVATAAALRRAGMQPPELRDTVREFHAIVYNHGLLDDEAIEWLSSVDTSGVSDPQRLGLAFTRRTGSITNQQYRTVTGVDAQTATRDLTALAAEGLLAKSGDRRWAKWVLAGELDRSAARQQPLELDLPGPRRANRRNEVVRMLATGAKSTGELGRSLGLGREGVLKWLRQLEADGVVRTTEEHRTSRSNRWMLVDSEAAAEELKQMEDDA